MYWLAKLYKIPIGARFIIASKNTTKPLLGIISKICKILFKEAETFLLTAHFIQVTKNLELWKILFQLLKN